MVVCPKPADLTGTLSYPQDEIGTEAEALAARSISQRGVQLVATAHGGELTRLIKNPTLSDLIGGIQTCAACTPPSICARRGPWGRSQQMSCYV